MLNSLVSKLHLTVEFTYLLERSDEKLVIKQLTKDVNFDVANDYEIYDLIEVYRPFPDTKKSVLRHSWYFKEIDPGYRVGLVREDWVEKKALFWNTFFMEHLNRALK